MQEVDLRSDTVTHPSPEMREAIANAKIGDDVFSDDPSVNRLEEMAASMMVKRRQFMSPVELWETWYLCWLMQVEGKRVFWVIRRTYFALRVEELRL